MSPNPPSYPVPSPWNTTQAIGPQAQGPISQFEIGDQKNFVYVVQDWSTGSAALVDPQADITEPLRWIMNNSLKLTSILLTHTHFDHIAGLEELCSLFPKIPVHVHPEEKLRIKIKQWTWEPVFDEEAFKVGNLRVLPIHTPGHTSGEICYHIPSPAPGYLLSGDMLFIRDCGRTDLPTGSNEEMFQSLKRLRKLPPQTILLPGHHYAPEVASTLGQEFVTSPPFLAKTVAELAAL